MVKHPPACEAFFLNHRRHCGAFVESIVLSIISMLSSPNDKSPANVKAARFFGFVGCLGDKVWESDLEIPIAIHPTRETVMYPFYSKWIRGHRDLPLKLNQWCNVVRWEFSNPTPFIRSPEFLWQEGHTTFAIKEEADVEVLDILELYRHIYEEYLVVPIIKGKKSELEKFAGGLYITNVEIGVVVVVHGDDKGLVLPPKVALVQFIVILVPYNAYTQGIFDAVSETVNALSEAGVRAESYFRDNYSPGMKLFSLGNEKCSSKD
ncbi:hypothetical protein RJT34_07539 [Clitoria ternatea]|uniref:Aminoacyl-transfer RNA synthetases class-II family profile domain-containing protein n=1 Tax=Clitoria ternatea TaxID=43366 RepID=A0AAN9K2Q6_CLITE